MRTDEFLAVLGFIPDDDHTARDEPHLATYKKADLERWLIYDLGMGAGADLHIEDVVHTILREDSEK